MFGSRGAGASRSSDDLHNEDSFLVADEFGLYAVCDGHGSAPAGEVAADLAVDAVKEYLAGVLRDGDDASAEGSASSSATRPTISVRTVEAAMRHALESLVDAAHERPELAGMETTVTLLLVQRGRAFVGHSGDSRAYLIRDGRLVQLTTDQEWTSAGDRSERPSRLGIESFSLPTDRGDTFILCTDGAEAEVSNPDLVDSADDYSPRLIASRIVAAAHRHDPSVDATVVVVRIHQDVDFGWAREIDPSPPETLTRARTLRRSGRPSQRPYSFGSSFGRASDRPFDRDSSGSRRSASKLATDA